MSGIHRWFCSLHHFLSAGPLRPLGLIPLRPFDPPHELNVLRHPLLSPDTPAQRHGRYLQKHLELRCQATVDTGGRGYPLGEALEWAIEEAGADVLAGEGGWSGTGLGVCCCGRRGRGEGEGMGEDQDHVC